MLRYANLPQGANLHLVQASRSPSVISVALQLPASENNARLTHKFPSTTSFWQILRRFESGAAGGASSGSTNLNFTQRGVPQMDSQGSGAGRLHYEMPVIQVMNRELGSFSDLQKTLAQVGLTSGSALLRLSFKNSGRPLEEAMADISQYFKTDEQDQAPAADAAMAATTSGAAQDKQESVQPTEMAPQEETTSQEPSVPQQEITPAASSSAAETAATAAPELNVDGPDHRPMTVFAAPTGPAPNDPRFNFNDSDYEPTEYHAKQHQARLNAESRNKRLASDAEIAAAEKAKEQKLAAISEIRIRVRLPDQTSVEANFTQTDTASSLYSWIRPMMELQNEPFVLKFTGPKGLQETLEDAPTKLVAQLGFQGRTLVNFTWDEQAGVEARQKPVLKADYRQQAQQIKIDTPKPAPEEKKGFSLGSLGGNSQKKSGGGGGDKEAKLKKLLGFGKK